MGTTLVVNTGSSSKKYALYRQQREVLFVTVTKEQKKVRFALRKNSTWLVQKTISEAEYANSIQLVVEAARTYGCIRTTDDITRVGVRIVAPGTFFQKHQLIDAYFVDQLQERAQTAPLHIPPTLREIEVLQQLLPNALLIAASDTAFHTTLPKQAATYTIPSEDAEQYGIRRYGYHGLSVAAAVRRVESVTKHPCPRLVVCHLGSGASVTAVRDGKSVDTTMGFSPGSGLPMASRAGDVESGAVLELMRVKHMNLFDTYVYLQTRGGLQGIAHEVDIRHVLERYRNEDEAARQAIDTFVYHVKKAIGAYMAALGGIDAVVFTATAGERSAFLRAQCLVGLDTFGIKLDTERNDALVNADGVISPNDSPVTVAVLRTGEVGEIVQIAESFQEV